MLRAEGLVKCYGQTVVLNRVSLQVQPGEIRALLGENGAGKSTLVKILSGIVSPDAGRIEIDGKAFAPGNLMLAREAGVATAFQELSLLPNLTVADNLMLPCLAKGVLGYASVQRNRDAAQAVLAAFDAADIPADLRVEALSLAQKQRLEIVRSFKHRPRLLILDEPTAALAEPEWLFDQIERLASSGTAVLFITHRLAEVRRLCQRATVLRNGECIDTFELARVDDRDLFGAMAGTAARGRRAGASAGAAEQAVSGPAALAVRDLSGHGVSSVSLSLQRGEVLGVAALDGQGQRELLRMLGGALVSEGGTIERDGQVVHLASPGEALQAGIAYLPEERKTEGAFLGLGVETNISIAAVERLQRFGLIDRTQEAEHVQAQARRVELAERLLSMPMSALSGGNQQKALLARVLLSGARVLVLFDPTRGVDVGTKQVIYDVIRRFADEGGSVLVYSTELEELVRLVDRCVVIYRGTLVADLPGQALSELALVTLASGHGTSAVSQAGPAPPPVPSRAPSPTPRSRAARMAAHASDNGALIAAVFFAALFAIYAARLPQALTVSSVTDLLNNTLPLALAAAGATLVVLTRGFDLSVAGVVSLANVLIATGPTEGPWAPLVALAMVVAAGMAVGAINGLLVAYGRLQSVTATLGTMIVCSGIALLVLETPGGSVPDFIAEDLSGTLGGWLPITGLLGLALAAAWLVVRRTDWGVALYAVGADAPAAELAGISVKRVQLLAYVAAGALYGLAGYALTALTASGDPNAGSSYLITAFAAIAIGGTSFNGGRGGLIGALVGAATLTLLLKVLFALGVLSFATGIAQGLVMIAAVLLGAWAARGTPASRMAV